MDKPVYNILYYVVGNLSEEWLVNSVHTKDEFIKHVERQYEEHGYVKYSFKTGKQRSDKQRKALEVYCKLLAERLNAAGYDMRMMLLPGVDIPWSQDRVKEFLWRPLQMAVTGHKSSTKPEKKQYIEIYEILNRHTAQKRGISLPWPCKEDSQ